MRYLVLSDIHDNRTALERVLKEIPSLMPDKVVFLGDIIGYGAKPQECLDLAKKVGDVFILGNFEYALKDGIVPSPLIPTSFNPFQWTFDHMSEDNKNFIAQFKIEHVENGVSFYHANPHQPEEFEYITNANEADRAFRYTKTSVTFVGHTHVPVLFAEGDSHAYELEPGTYQLHKDQKYIINPGSVGQQRNKDKRVSFVVYNTSQLIIEAYRYEYNNQEAAQHIREAGLPESFARNIL